MAKRRRSDGEEEEYQEESSSWSLSSLWNWLPSFGTLLMVGLVALFGFFAASAGWLGDGVKGFVDKLLPNGFGGIVDMVKAGLLGDKDAADRIVDQAAAGEDVEALRGLLQKGGLNEDQAKLFAPDMATARANLKLLKGRDGHYGLDDQVIFNVLTKNPTLARGLFEARTKSDPGQPLDDNARKMLDGVKTLVADSARLKTMIANPQALDALAGVLGPMLPVSGPNLSALVRSMALDAKGNVRPEFQTLIATALTPDAEGKLPPAASLVAAATQPGANGAPPVVPPQAMADIGWRLVQSLDEKVIAGKAPAGMQDLAVQGVRLLKSNEAATRTLLTSMTPQDATPLIDALTSGDPQKIEKQLLTPKYAAPLAKFAQSVEPSTVPAGTMKTVIETARNPAMWNAAIAIEAQGVSPFGLVKSILATDAQNNIVLDKKGMPQVAPDKVAGLLLDPAGPLAKPGVVQHLGVLASATVPVANQQNLAALTRFGVLVARNPGNAKNPDVKKVVTGILSMALNPNNKAPFGDLPPEKISAFFRDPVNGEAIRRLLSGDPQKGGLDYRVLSAAQKGICATLRDHAGEVFVGRDGGLDTGRSYGLLEVLADPVALGHIVEQMKNPTAAKMTETEAGWKLWGAGIVGGHFGVPNLGTIPENRADVVALMKVTGSLAPSPTPEQNTKAIIRSRNGLGVLG